MTKKELIASVADTVKEPASSVEAILDDFAALIAQELEAGRKVSYSKLGTFSVSHRAARVGRNPQTGDPVSIAAKRAVKFKAAADLDRTLNP